MRLRQFLVLSILQGALLWGDEQYGKIDFPTSLPEDQQKLFIKGVLLLHNFQYLEAREIFLALENQSPDFPLAFWGEAMTYNQPIWVEQELLEGQKALQKLGKTSEERIAKGSTPKEKGLIRAIDALYFSSKDKRQRDRQYAENLYELYKQFPNDDEIATFYALSLLGKEEGRRNIQEYMRAASVVNDVMTRNPLHPGAMHYFIHAVDDPVHAPLGLNAARAYSKIVKDAPHALHMPSHIYLALGMWDDVIESNQKAWDATSPDKPDLHVLQWLHYGYLQKGNYNKANELLHKVYQITQASRNPDFNWYYIHLKAAQVSADPSQINLPPAVNLHVVQIDALADELFTDALIKLLQKEDLQSIIDKMAALLVTEKAKYANQSMYPEPLLIANAIDLQIQALNYRAKENKIEAYKALEKAIEIEKSIPFGFGPPLPPRPSKELLAEFYFQDGQFQKACDLYQEVLRQFPNKLISVNALKELNQKHHCLVEKNIFFNRLISPQEVSSSND